ncbi:MAG: pilus assembly protein [Methylocystis sp.]|nr:pilus assembly protein [Methylocystis sp.]
MWLGEFLRRRDGAVAVEFAMVALPFLALIIAILQIGIVFLAQQELETAVEQSSRLVLTGQAQQQNLSQSNFAAKVCDSLPALFACANLMIDMQTASSFANANASAPTLNFDANGQVTNKWQYQKGNQGDIVVMRVMYQWPVFLGPLGFNLSNLSNGNRLLTATAVFKNEPY